MCYGTPPTLSLDYLRTKSASSYPEASSSDMLSYSTRSSEGGVPWDLSNPLSRKVSAAEYRKTEAFKDKRAEKRRTKRATTGSESRRAASVESRTCLLVTAASFSGTGYTGSLTKLNRTAVEDLWAPAAQAEAESDLLPIPYELSFNMGSWFPGPLTKLNYSPSSQGPMFLVDAEGRRFSARSFLHKTMNAAWMGGLLRRISIFADACKLTRSGIKHPRGLFTQRVLGMGHGTGENYNVSHYLLKHETKYLIRLLNTYSCLIDAHSIMSFMSLFQICWAPLRCKISCLAFLLLHFPKPF
jgi:hypothetical protein